LRKPVFFFLSVGLAVAPVCAVADTATDQQLNAAAAQISALEKQITDYQSALTQLGSQKNTLQNAIDSLTLSIKKVTANVSVTQAKITQANLKLKELGGAITDKEMRIQNDEQSIGESLQKKYQISDTTLVEALLSQNGLIGAWDEATALTELESAIEADRADLVSTKQSLTKDYNSTQAQQAQLVALKKQLASQQAQLNQTKQQQTALLAQTKDSEANYQKLLASAQAQLASYSAFAQNAGGSGLLGNQTVCDSWGCYYNQRDQAWGNMHLSGTADRLAADGCLVTSMAMVLTHYGYTDVTPVSINSNPANFSAVGGLMLYTTYVDNISAERLKESVTTRTIDAILATGNPAIVGIYAYGGTHFVVLVSVKSGSYLMRDPYIANGKDISFTAHYSVRNIYEVNKVIIG
jgi:peptidoglycan hydrolase CwlO-like protein